MGIQGKIKIINLILDGLNKLIDDAKLSDPQFRNRHDRLWSRKIKTSLCNIGYELDYYVCANRVDCKFANSDKKIAHHGEWLYDVTWMKYQNNHENGNPNPDSNLIEIPFAAECEWKNAKHVKEDFEKLLQARAGIRLMICNSSIKNSAQEVAEWLANMVGTFNDSQTNDVNLLATWERVGSRTDGDWKFRYFELGFGTFEPLERMC